MDFVNQAEIISRHYEKPESNVRVFLNIPCVSSVKRFLSPESLEELKRRGYTLNGNYDPNLKLRLALSVLYLPEFRKEFYRTNEGSLWYEFNVAVPCARVGMKVSDITTKTKPDSSPSQRAAAEINQAITRFYRCSSGNIGKSRFVQRD